MGGRESIVVAGYGMVGHKLVELLVGRGAERDRDIVVLAEEPRPAYDRVGLSTLFTGATEGDLALAPADFYQRPGVELHLGDPVVGIDREATKVTTASGAVYGYDALVLATGSSPFVPPLPGSDLAGCFVYRTIDDLNAIRGFASGKSRGVVIGGGLLGLEAANVLKSLGLETYVVEYNDRLMNLQTDEGGGAMLRRHIEDLGLVVHTSRRVAGVREAATGGVGGLSFDGAEDLDVDIVVFAAGIRPRDELARACGIAVGERGGIGVDDRCQTDDPRIYALGECAFIAGRTWGLVSPGYQMARVVADQLCADEVIKGDVTFTGADLSTKLKLLGVEVASFGDAHGATTGAEAVTYTDPIAKVHKRLVLGPPEGGNGKRAVIGGVLVGDSSAYTTLTQMARGDLVTPENPELLILPQREAGGAAAPTLGVAGMADSATVCSCNNVSKGTICGAISDGGLAELSQVKLATEAGTGCGGCVPVVTELLKDLLRDRGVEVNNHLCEHFAFSRQELLHLMRVEEITTFSHLLTRHGSGQGCEICKPAVASILASLGNGYILAREQAGLQDTNDRFLANLQRDGTYSVVPRVPGGEITPDQLVVIGQVAKEFGLYTKITGGQRIDLLGARVDDLPAIWRRLIDAGMESGHAYGKALRTVKSCVGKTWCRFGVQDSTTLAIDLELRYRGLRSPHKIKCAVSGCVRECAEAQGKDVGVIATEKGWNLFVCGNGGMKPQHAVLFAADLDTETLMRYIDRFLMFYIRTADRLERTSTWLNKLDGGIDYLRSVVIDDSLGVCAALEDDMAKHVAAYECEWTATVNDPVRVKHFRSFVNTLKLDASVVQVPERGQMRPAYEHEREEVLLR